MLNLKDIVLRYDGMEVLKGISIEAKRGMITTIVGANGAGKTTTLRAISGLAPITSGEIWFMGEKISSMKAIDIVKRGITHVPEGRGLFPWMSVYDNLMTGAWLRNDRIAIARDLERVYEYFPVLRQMKTRLARNMSGGEQQMLAFGRGLMAHPKLYLLDEPSIGLAPLFVQSVMQTIRRIAKEEKIGVILVEQNAAIALEVADTAYVLELGKVVLEGKPSELKNDSEVRKVYLGI